MGCGDRRIGFLGGFNKSLGRGAPQKAAAGPRPLSPLFLHQREPGDQALPACTSSTYPPPMLQPLLLNSHPAFPGFQQQPSHPLYKPRTDQAVESLATVVVAAVATAIDAWWGRRVGKRETQPSALPCRIPHSSQSHLLLDMSSSYLRLSWPLPVHDPAKS